MTIEVTAQFEITLTRFLDVNGKPLGELPDFANDAATLQDLYRWMVLTRLFDHKAINLQRTGKMGTYASSLGQEAIMVAFGHAMKTDDVLVPAYREYGAQLQRGVSMTEILAFWGGSEQANCYKNCPEDFPMAVPIGTQPLHAAGVGVAMKYRKQNRAAVSVCGDGATSEGDFYEAINVAGAWQLPVVFVVINNQWAISLARHQQTNAQTLAQKAIAGGIRGLQVDGNDLIAMYDVAKVALDRARSGKGPTLIEAVTYRLHDHTTADDATRYRSKEETQTAWDKEPIRRLKNFLTDRGWWNETRETAWLADCQSQIDAAVEAYFNLPPEKTTDMFDHHYAQLPHDLIDQRQIAEAYQHLIKDHH